MFGVRKSEEIFRSKTITKKNSANTLSNYEKRMQNDISFQLDSKVVIKKKIKGNGQIIINFKNQDHLNEILDNFD